MTDKRESRLRRIAQRRGLILRKSRKRDALDFGYYVLINSRNAIVYGLSNSGHYAASLDDVEEWLTGQ